MPCTFAVRTVLALGTGLSLAGVVHAAPMAAPGYSVSLFAAAPAGASAPDSITVVGGNVYVGYGNGGAPDGAGGATSTIAEYSVAGHLLNTTTVVGHNDGLKYNPATGQIWALQTGVLNGNTTATMVNGGGTTTLNLQDPDSMTLSPTGQLVLDSQADQQLVFVTNPGASQSVSVLNLTNQIDDTAFAGVGASTLLVADKGDNSVYAITGMFAPGAAYSAAAGNAGQSDFVGQLNLANGTFAPIVTGLSNPGGEAFLTTVPEPASLAMLGTTILGLIVVRRRT